MATQGVGCDSWLAAGSGVGSGCAPDPALDSQSSRACLLGVWPCGRPGPAGSTDHRGCLLSTRDSPLFTAAPLQVLTTPESHRSGRNGAYVEGTAGAQVWGGRQRCGQAAGLGRAGTGSLQPCRPCPVLGRQPLLPGFGLDFCLPEGDEMSRRRSLGDQFLGSPAQSRSLLS